MPYACWENTFKGSMKQIIEKFGCLNEKYENNAEDAAHWYGEQACTAMLSVAAWQCGFPAICEANTVKRRYNGNCGRPRSHNGRTDLFFFDENDVGLWIEAKKVSHSMDASENSDYPVSFRRLTRWFWMAYEDSYENRHEAHKNDGYIGCILFCSFVLGDNYYNVENEQYVRFERAREINGIIRQVIEEDEGDCFFASFFNTDETEVIDEIGNRSFGFAVLGYFDEA